MAGNYNKSLASLGTMISDTRNFFPMGYNYQKPTPTSLSDFITKVQFIRLAADLKDLRDAYSEAEYGFFPMRVKFQRIFMNVVENPVVKTLLDRAKELTSQRDWYVYQIKNGKRVKSEDLSSAINEQHWLADYIDYIIDAVHFGYSLIELGEIDTGNRENPFPGLSFTRRENIRPDGVNKEGAILGSIPYLIDGIKIENNSLEPLIPLCNHWIGTKSNRGVSKCGYGLLANIAKLEINHRHIEEWQVDYIESFGTPTLVGETRKQGDKRKTFEKFLANAAANKFILLDPATGDKITYEMPPSAGTGYKVFSIAKKEIEGLLSQSVLGHSDAIVSLPGKLGGQQAANKDGFNESLIEQAINSKQMWYGNFTCRKLNEVSFPKFRELGRRINVKFIRDLVPEGYYFGLTNDKEEQELIRRTNASMKVTSDLLLNMFNAGLRPKDVKTVNEWTKKLGFGEIEWREEEPDKHLTETRRTNTNVTTDSLDKPDAEPHPSSNDEDDDDDEKE